MQTWRWLEGPVIPQVFILLTMVSWPLLACPDAATSPDSAVGIEVTPGSRDGHLELQFSITNPSSSPVLVSQRTLPWGSREGALIAGASWEPGKAWDGLEPVMATEEQASSDVITIPPGGVVQGWLSLDSRIQKLAEALRSADVVVFWFCEPKTIDHKSLGPRGGFIVIPKGGLEAELTTGPRAEVASAVQQIHVAVEASRAGLDFSIANASSDPIQIDRGDLPGLSPWTIVVAGVVEGSRVLESHYPMIGLPYGEVTLLPGETLADYLPFDRRVPEIHSVLGRKDVVMFWLYEGRLADGRSFGRHGGFVVLSGNRP